MRPPMTTFRFPCLLICLLGLAGAASLHAAPPAGLPPLVQPASGEHHEGKVIWLDLVTPNLAAAEQFYGGLFGWTFQNVTTGYALAMLEGRAVCGIYQRAIPAGEHRQSNWLTFVAVANVETAQAAILQQGGKMVSPPHAYPQRGKQAVFTDPQGAVFAVLASSSGDPPDYLAAPGEWIWSSVIASDSGTDAAFYQNVFGYQVFDATQDSDNTEHLILSTDDFARLSINQLPDDSARRHPHWIHFVRVTDTVQTVSKVAGLGGRVLVEPRLGRHGGKVAVLADFAGAPFGVLEWSEDEKAEAPQ
jgi:predicted enzyme related to lactoylglutathione lyase